MLGTAAHLPEPGIAFGPDAADQVSDLRQPTADIGIDRPAGLRVEPGGLEQIAVNIELKLPGRSVPDPDGCRAAVTSKRERPFTGLGTAIEPVENLQTRVGQLGCLHEPPEEGIRLVDTPEAEQGAQHEGSVPHPAEPVVPVALAAD